MVVFGLISAVHLFLTVRSRVWWGSIAIIGGICHRVGAKTPCGFAKHTHPPIAAVAPEAALDDFPLHWTEAVLATVRRET